MKDFNQKAHDFLSQFGSRGEAGKLSHSSLDREFIFDFLGVYFFGNHSKSVKNDHDELEASKFFYTSQNEELDKLVNERIDSFFDIENLRKELSHKLYIEKKPIFFNFATDLAQEGFVFDSRRYFYYHSLNKEEGPWRGAVNLAQIFFLAFKIENINYHEYKEIFSVFCSRIIKLYRYCVVYNIHDVSEFTGYSYFIEKKGLELELFQHKKLKELFENSDFVSTFMHICNSVQLDKNQFFDFYSVLSPVSDLMFEIYKASTEDKDYFTHIQKYLHYVKVLSDQSESELSFEDYNVSRQRKDSFRQMFTGKIIKLSFVLSGGLMPVKDQILSIFYNWRTYSRLQKYSDLDIYYQSLILKSRFYRADHMTISSELRKLMIIEYYCSIVRVPLEISKHLMSSELDPFIPYTTGSGKREKSFSGKLLDILVEQTHFHGQECAKIIEVEGLMPSLKDWFKLLIAALWMAMVLFVFSSIVLMLFTIRFLAGFESASIFTITYALLYPLCAYLYVIFYPLNFTLYKNRIRAIVDHKAL